MSDDDCIFCRNMDTNWLGATPTFVIQLDRFPVSRGHTLIIPRQHVVSFFDLTPDEVAEAYEAISAASMILLQRYEPDGFNIGVDEGRAAGRTVDHLYIHLIPRYKGDVPDPRGGIRNILPGPSRDQWSTAS